MDIDVNLQKEKHQDRIQKQLNIHQQLIKQALKNYNRQIKMGLNTDPKLQVYDFKLLKPYYFQLKDPFKGHWMKQIPKSYYKEKKQQKQEQDLHQLL
ncbi:unnamed protein product [Paramecium pentaurelia]|uniref:Uncharacterized protein n=1 Tax=Paramecium pentaurelia TaxID=43138 RepID=A0A8S1VZ76_9CILI|nr:unnamed protein product [Paramecium pentaurelia]